MRFVLKKPLYAIRVVLAGMLGLVLSTPALAQACLGRSITPVVETQPDRFGALTYELLFDGNLTNSGEASLRLSEPPAIGENALLIDIGQPSLAASSILIFFDVADADSSSLFATIPLLQSAGLDAGYFDRNGNGQLEQEGVTPVQLLTQRTSRFQLVSREPFDQIAIESLPDLNGGDSRITETRLNGVSDRSFEQDGCDALAEENFLVETG